MTFPLPLSLPTKGSSRGCCLRHLSSVTLLIGNVRPVIFHLPSVSVPRRQNSSYSSITSHVVFSKLENEVPKIFAQKTKGFFF